MFIIDTVCILCNVPLAQVHWLKITMREKERERESKKIDEMIWIFELGVRQLSTVFVQFHHPSKRFDSDDGRIRRLQNTYPSFHWHGMHAMQPEQRTAHSEPLNYGRHGGTLYGHIWNFCARQTETQNKNHLHFLSFRDFVVSTRNGCLFSHRQYTQNGNKFIVILSLFLLFSHVAVATILFLTTYK